MAAVTKENRKAKFSAPRESFRVRVRRTWKQISRVTGDVVILIIKCIGPV